MRKPKERGDLLYRNINASAFCLKRRPDVRSRLVDGELVVLDREALLPGNAVAGPAVIESPTSTLVVHPGQQASVDPYRNVILTESEDAR